MHTQHELDGLRRGSQDIDIMGGIVMLRGEVDSLQVEIARAKREFAEKQGEWERERRGLLQEVNTLRDGGGGGISQKEN